MNRDIKFKGLNLCDEWVYGSYIDYINQKKRKRFCMIVDFDGKHHCVKDTSVCQFTGLLDKNKKEIWEGDIISFYKYSNYIQQSFPELRPEIDETYISRKTEVVRFRNGMFVSESKEKTKKFDYIPNEMEEIFESLIMKGIYSIEEMIEQCIPVYYRDEIQENGYYVDCNANELNEGKLGIEVIGNIFNNPELIK